VRARPLDLTTVITWRFNLWLTTSMSRTYADDCLVDRVQKHRVYLVATNVCPHCSLSLSGCTLTSTQDRNLKRRLRKVPGVPLMSVGRGKFVIERLPGVSET
jgi:U3 small nucleolar RNA-associated protein 24